MAAKLQVKMETALLTICLLLRIAMQLNNSLSNVSQLPNRLMNLKRISLTVENSRLTRQLVAGLFHL